VSVGHRLSAVAVLFALASVAAAQTVGPTPGGLLTEPLGPAFVNASAGGVAPAVERLPLGKVAANNSGDDGAAPVADGKKSQGAGDAGGMGVRFGQPALAAAGVSALIVVLGFAIRLVFKNRGGLLAALGPGGRAPSGLIEVLARYPVGRQSTLIVLKIDRRVLLLNQAGASRGSMTVLTEFCDPEEVASILLRTRDETEARSAQRFQGILAGASEPYEAPVSPSKEAHGAPIGGSIGLLRRHLRNLAATAAGGVGSFGNAGGVR